MFQRVAIAREHRRAMRHRYATLRQQAEIAAALPMDQRVMVEEHAMADGGIRRQEAHLVQPLDRRQPVATGHLMELDHALRRMGLQRQLAGARRLH